jgi:hypothetical protein
MDTEPERKPKDKNEESAQATESKTTKTQVDQFASLTKRLLVVSRDELRAQEDKWREESA